jgi:hypothetical protein
MSRTGKRTGKNARPLPRCRSGLGTLPPGDKGPPVPLPLGPGHLEDLERRLESSLAGGPAPEPFEPCVWFCACFLVHGA